MPEKIALAHGCFDLLHLGHIRYLQAAKKLADSLIVTVTADKYVNKGNGRPIWSQEERVEMLAALHCVDIAMVNDAPDACDVLRLIKPDFYVKGVDYKNGSCQEFDIARSVGAKVVFTETEKFSTTELIKRIRA